MLCEARQHLRTNFVIVMEREDVFGIAGSFQFSVRAMLRGGRPLYAPADLQERREPSHRLRDGPCAHRSLAKEKRDFESRRHSLTMLKGVPYDLQGADIAKARRRRCIGTPDDLRH